MELSEDERVMFVKKKEEISQITSELLTERLSNSEKLSKMNQILSILSTLESYAKPDRDLFIFQDHVNKVSALMQTGMDTQLLISIFCSAANSVRFDLSKKRIRIPILIQIKELIFNKNQVG
jgi:hypothetical protein